MSITSKVRWFRRTLRARWMLKRMSEAKRGSLFEVALVEWSCRRAAKEWKEAATAMGRQNLMDSLAGHDSATAQKVSAQAERNMVVSAAQEVHAALHDASLPDQARRKVLVALGDAQRMARARAQSEDAAWEVMATGGLAAAEKQRTANAASDAAGAWAFLLRELADALATKSGEGAIIVDLMRMSARQYMKPG